MKRAIQFLLLVVMGMCGGLSPAYGQVKPSTLPRITSTNGLADSSLFICNDSTNTKTRSCTFFSMRKRLQFKTWDSLLVSRLSLGGGTVIGAPTWATLQTFATGQRVDSATGAARATLAASATSAVQLTNTRTIWGQNFNGTANVSGAITGASTGAFSGLLTAAGLTSSGTITANGFNILPAADNASQVGVSGTRFNSMSAYTGDFTTRVNAGTNVTGSVSKLVVGDGTALSANDAAVTTTLGALNTSSSVAVGNQYGEEVVMKATTGIASTYTAIRGYAWSSNTSGTFGTLRGVQGVAEAGGNGGTVTTADGVVGLGIVPTGATVTNLSLFHASAPTITGTATNLWGLRVDNMGSTTSQWAIQTGTGLVQFGDMAVLAPSTTTRAGLRQSSGTAPTSPAGGDMWYDGTNTSINSGLSVSGIVGTATNNSATAGNYGEYLSHTTAAGGSISLTSNVASTVDSLSLTAGDWDVSGSVDFTFGGTTSYTVLSGSVSTTRSVAGAQDSGFQFASAAMVPTAANPSVWTLPTTRFSVASTTKVYLVVTGTFSISTLNTYGTIRARRMR